MKPVQGGASAALSSSSGAEPGCIFSSLQTLGRASPSCALRIEHFTPMFRRALAGALDGLRDGDEPGGFFRIAGQSQGTLASDVGFRLYTAVHRRLAPSDARVFGVAVALQLAHESGECTLEELRFASKPPTDVETEREELMVTLGGAGVDAFYVMDSKMGMLAEDAARSLANAYPVPCALADLADSIAIDKVAWAPVVAAAPDVTDKDLHDAVTGLFARLTPVQTFALRRALSPHALTRHANELVSAYVGKVQPKSNENCLMEASDDAWKAGHPLLLHAAEAADESCASALLRAVIERQSLETAVLGWNRRSTHRPSSTRSRAPGARSWMQTRGLEERERWSRRQSSTTCTAIGTRFRFHRPTGDGRHSSSRPR